MRKFKLRFITLFILAIPLAMMAQQEAQYTQFAYNNMLLNPGFAGARRVASATALYRNQWMGYDGHPVSYVASFDAPLKKSRIGAGLTLANQKDGIIGRTMVNLALNYDVINTERMTFRIGMSGNLKRYSFNLQDPKVYIKNPGDVLLAQDNPYLLKSNLGMGIYFDMKSFYVGFSCPNLIKNPIELNENRAFDPNSVERRHAYLQAGGFFNIGIPRIHLKPTAMVKYVKNAPLSTDMNLGIMFDRTFLVGAGMRTGDSKFGGGNAMSATSFYQVSDQLGIGAAYDFTLNKIKNASSGTVEVLLRYDFVSNKKIWHNPRFFF